MISRPEAVPPPLKWIPSIRMFNVGPRTLSIGPVKELMACNFVPESAALALPDSWELTPSPAPIKLTAKRVDSIESVPSPILIVFAMAYFPAGNVTTPPAVGKLFMQVLIVPLASCSQAGSVQSAPSASFTNGMAIDAMAIMANAKLDIRKSLLFL